MPLIYATRSVLPSAKANSVQSAHMARELSALNPGAFIALYRSRQPSASPSDHFAHYGLTAPASVRVVTAVAPAWDALSYDVLAARRFFCHQPPATSAVYTRSLRLACTSASAGLRTFLELHDPLTPARVFFLRRLIASGRLRGLVATTTRLRDDLLHAFPAFPAEHILVAGNAAPASMLTLPALPLPRRGAFNIGYAGSAFRGKGLEIVLACALLMPEAVFHVIGPDREACERLGSLSPNVALTGRLPHPQVLGLLKSMDALLLPNQPSVIIRGGADIGAHTSPLKLFEYLATGRPVIASDLPVFHGILRNEYNCLLARADSPADFTARLDRLRANPALAAALGAHAQRDFTENHTWTRRATRIQNFITQHFA